MTIRIRRALGLGALALGTAACTDFLTDVADNPNNPTEITSKNVLFVGVTSSQFTQQEGQLARWAGMYVGHVSGVGRQQLNYQRYSINENEVTTYWNRFYTGGGLVDIREVQRLALADGDSIYAGIAYVMEAFMVGTATSLWGDMPYSQALRPAEFPTPALDPQQEIYAAVQAKLDTARILLRKTGGANVGPAAQSTNKDLFYGAPVAQSVGQWLRLSATLKARYYMHTVERDPSAADLALSWADSGIADPTGAADFRTYHSALPTEKNIWFQFLSEQRNGDLAPGNRLIQIMLTRPAAGGGPDPRLPNYFNQVSGTYRGGNENGTVVGGTTPSAFSTTRNTPDYRQTLVSYVENELIAAEAAWRTGEEGTARTRLNNARAAAGLTAIAATVTGTALRDVIFEEKYIAMFQNIEAWSDYRRNCYPGGVNPPTGFTRRIAKLPYGFAETNANPNVPVVADPTQPRMWTDPNECP